MDPKPGDLLWVDGRASVQFSGTAALMFRVTAVSARTTYYGWAWLVGYVINREGLAEERREIFVQPAGLRPARPPRLGGALSARSSVRRRGV